MGFEVGAFWEGAVTAVTLGAFVGEERASSHEVQREEE
jgi:hypothetical protein